MEYPYFGRVKIKRTQGLTVTFLPEVITSETGRPALVAIKPTIEKTTNPAKKLVPQLTRGITTESLKSYKQVQYSERLMRKQCGNVEIKKPIEGPKS